MKNEITVVIPYMGDRMKNLKRAAGSLDRQTVPPCTGGRGCGVMVAYYGEHEKCKELDMMRLRCGGVSWKNVEFRYCGGSADFCRTRACNAGVSHVQTELTAILDADCILSPPALADARALIESGVGLVGAPFFSMQESGRSERFPFNGRLITGGFMVFRTADYLAVGGMNPFMMGWGYEDRDLVERMTNYRVGLDRKPGMAVAYLPYPYFHQWHEPAGSPEEKRAQEEANIQIARTSVWDGKEWRMTK